MTETVYMHHVHLSCYTHLFLEQLQHLVEALVYWELSGFQHQIRGLGTLVIRVDPRETWQQMWNPINISIPFVLERVQSELMARLYLYH